MSLSTLRKIIGEHDLELYMVEYLKETGRVVNLDPFRSVFDGWEDRQAKKHLRSEGCALVFPEKVMVQNGYVADFNTDQIEENPVINLSGIDTPIRCNCGALDDITLRREGSFDFIVAEMLGISYRGDFTFPTSD